MKIAIGAIVALVILIGGVYLINRSANKTPTTAEQAVDENVTPETPTAENPTAGQAGAYVDYSDSIIATTAGTKILFFHAPWCPQCRALDASIKGSQIPNGVTIIKVDYDTNQQLRQKYGVTIQTTLVKVDDNGESVEKYVAYDEPTFSSVKNNLL